MSYSSSVKASELSRVRAAAYGLIAHGFRYPERSDLSMLIEPKRWERWPEVLQALDGQVTQPLQFLRKVVSALANCSDEAYREIQHRYDEIFGHAVRGRCPAYEMEYGRNEIIRQASDLADLAGFYRAFGLEITSGANGRPDHITAECEFMSALCSKEAYAHTQADGTSADICLDAERGFLRDHLARWLPAFAHSVDEADGDGLFGALARFANAFVAAECRHFDVHAGPATLELKVPDPDRDTHITCGSSGCGEARPGQQFIQIGLDQPQEESGDETC